MRAYLTVIGSMTFLVACSSSTSDGGLDGTATGGTSSSAGGSSSVGGASSTGGAATGKGGSGPATGGSTAGPGAGGAATGGNTTGAGGNTTGTGGSGTAGATTGKGGSGTAGTASGTGGSGTAGTSSGGPPSTCAQANGDLGCCDGDNLYFCQGTMGPSMQACAGKGCGWDPMKNWYDCGFTGSDPSGTTPLMCGGGSSGTGGTGSGGTGSGTGGSGTTGSYDCPNDASDPLAAARIECVKTINNYRATLSLPLLKRWCGNATCEDKQGTQDFMKNTAHSAFGQCGEFAQDECPGWPDTPLASIDGCLMKMWAEGPGPAGCASDPTCYKDHGHYLNMSSTKYSMVECGFSEVGGGKWWGVQDFKLVRGFSPISARAGRLRTSSTRRAPPEPTSTKLPGLISGLAS